MKNVLEKKKIAKNTKKYSEFIKKTLEKNEDGTKKGVDLIKLTKELSERREKDIEENNEED